MKPDATTTNEPSRRWVSTLARWGICIVAVGWILNDIDWVELKRTLAEAQWSWALLGLVTFGPAPMLIAQRLRWLLEVHGIHISYWQAVKVTFAGNFLIQAFPIGTPGGDSAKAYYIARDTPHKHEAALTVFFDRVLGTASLLLMSGIVVLVNWKNPAFAKWGRIIGVLIVVLMVGGGAYFSHRVRRWLHMDAIVARLPLAGHFQRLDRALFAYRHHVNRLVICLLLTLGLQTLSVLCYYLVGRGLGLHSNNAVTSSAVADLFVYLGYTPICFLAGALPMGAMELTFAELFSDAAGLGTPEQAFSLSFLGRMVQLIWALPGLIVVMRGKKPTFPENPSHLAPDSPSQTPL